MDAKEKRVVVSLVSVTVALTLSVGVSLMSNVLLIRLDMVGGLIELIVLTISLFAIRRAKASPNDDFNFGLAKLENLCGLLFSQVQLVYLVIFAWLAVNRLLDPVPPQGAGWGAVLYAYGVTVTGAMMLWTGSLNRNQPSPVAEALWRGYQTKFAANSSTVVAVALAALFSDHGFAAYIDPIVVLALCGLRLRNTYRTLVSSGRDLLDAAVEERVRLIILRELAATFDAYDDLLAYETRRAPGRVFVTIHLGFTKERTLDDVLALSHRLSSGIAMAVEGAQVSLVPHGMQPEPAG